MGKKNGHPTILNSFGVDTKKVLAKTVPEATEILHITVNHDSWDAKDKSKFEKEYGITCTRRSVAEADEHAKELLRPSIRVSQNAQNRISQTGNQQKQPADKAEIKLAPIASEKGT